MAIFIKTEIIKKNYLKKINLRKETIKNHIKWVKELKRKGLNIESGFLIDKMKKAGGGGLLIIECESYADAEKIIKDDPMIKNKFVDWKLHEWIDVISDNKN